jgi:preprotein translocase SecF subunit
MMANASQTGAKVSKLQELFGTRLAEAGPQVLRVDYVGPQIGKELRNEGFISLVYAIIGIMVYLSLRFDFRFGSGAVIKLIPDTFAILAFYLLFHRPFDLTTVAALLTGIGYSVNDVIVVYDRIRENMSSKKARPFSETIEISINETLVRTVKTSVVTSLSLLGIVVFGPDTIRNFAIAMIVGIASATFSSIFIGSGYLLWIDAYLKKREAQAQTKAPHPASQNS